MARAAAYDREKALDAALNLFWAKGYNATSLKDLEEALGMRPGSIYVAFHSKEALFRATLDRYADRMVNDLSARLDASGSMLDVLRDYLLSLGGLDPQGKPSTACMLVKSLLEISTGNPELRGVVLTHLARVEEAMAQGFERARQAGEIAPNTDPARLARRMQTYVFGLKVQAQRVEDPLAMRRLAEDLADEFNALRPMPVG